MVIVTEEFKFDYPFSLYLFLLRELKDVSSPMTLQDEKPFLDYVEPT